MPAVEAMLVSAWTSCGITLEQTTADMENEMALYQYFWDKDDAEMGGHWNMVSGTDKLYTFLGTHFRTDGYMSFSQFKA